MQIRLRSQSSSKLIWKTTGTLSIQAPSCYSLVWLLQEARPSYLMKTGVLRCPRLSQIRRMFTCLLARMRNPRACSVQPSFLTPDHSSHVPTQTHVWVGLSRTTPWSRSSPRSSRTTSANKKCSQSNSGRTSRRGRSVRLSYRSATWICSSR